MRVLCKDGHYRTFYISYSGNTCHSWSCTHCGEYITGEGFGRYSKKRQEEFQNKFSNHDCKERRTQLKTGEKSKIDLHRKTKSLHNNQHSANYNGPHGWG